MVQYEKCMSYFARGPLWFTVQYLPIQLGLQRTWGSQKDELHVQLSNC